MFLDLKWFLSTSQFWMTSHASEHQFFNVNVIVTQSIKFIDIPVQGGFMLIFTDTSCRSNFGPIYLLCTGKLEILGALMSQQWEIRLCTA